MDKKIYTLRYQAFLSLLKKARTDKGIAQRPFAKMLGVHQTYVSKVEVGERRLDIAELSFWCEALGINSDKLYKEWHLLYKAREKAAKAKVKDSKLGDAEEGAARIAAEAEELEQAGKKAAGSAQKPKKPEARKKTAVPQHPAAKKVTAKITKTAEVATLKASRSKATPKKKISGQL